MKKFFRFLLTSFQCKFSDLLRTVEMKTDDGFVPRPVKSDPGRIFLALDKFQGRDEWRR